MFERSAVLTLGTVKPLCKALHTAPVVKPVPVPLTFGTQAPADPATPIAQAIP